MQQNTSGNSVPGSEVEIRVLLEDDLAYVDELVQQAGWNQLRDDWLRVLRYEPQGCLAAIVDKHLIGTVTTTTYGKDLGWIGMMLVHPDFRRRGIASELMRRSIAYLRDKQVECIKLDATPTGQIVYEKLGFAAEWKFHRWELAANQLASTVHPNPSMHPDYALDRLAFGADRSALLNQLDRASFTVSVHGGYGMLRTGRRASYLGPVVASTIDIAEPIIRTFLSLVVGGVFWDIPGPNIAAQTIAKQLGFQPVRELTRMKLGDMSTTPNMLLQYAIAAPETG
jgi:ribosomal protein S18 acetylase RimI-like enzyme